MPAAAHAVGPAVADDFVVAVRRRVGEQRALLRDAGRFGCSTMTAPPLALRTAPSRIARPSIHRRCDGRSGDRLRVNATRRARVTLKSRSMVVADHAAGRRSPPARCCPGTPGTSRPRPPARPGSRSRRRRAPRPTPGSRPRSAAPGRSRPRPRADRHAAAEAQLGVEDVVAQLGDVHGLEPHPERLDDVPEQVVGQRAQRLHALLLERDGRGLDGADPDRQVAHAVLFAQQDDGLVGRQFDPNADDPHRMHARPPRTRGLAVQCKRPAAHAAPRRYTVAGPGGPVRIRR